MPQNEYIEQHIKQHGRRLDHEERKRKKEARESHRISKDAQRLTGWRGKQFAKKRYAEKVSMKKKIRAHEQSKIKGPTNDNNDNKEALPTYLLDRQEQNTAKAISSSIKQKRLEKLDKFSVPLPRVRGISEEEMFKVIKTGKKTKKKSWKRMITKHTFVGDNFTRKPVKLERIIRPSALRQKKANVTHPELGVTVFLPILSVKKNPQSAMYTQLGVLTKGTIIEVNVSELGMVTAGGKVVWGKYAQITNEPDRDGCVNAVLLV
ncbi:rRNA-processing protein NSA2 [Ascoidea rubescens DSM 1968]|uniref:Ribosome biogenesis protein NSA2 homolog n=1 Tax=Ascoidea rubescens DSM 1968 TaxID=1344418 RepID=A0A1D2VR98_9ASCO|nr:ribosome biogenesis protein NSA2 [Ascoidea rubescens DSM 1968]ODV64119.1 ribosome biogenesis protein NSA2 [Ascoidea rubescens DSM 1968]